MSGKKRQVSWGTLVVCAVALPAGLFVVMSLVSQLAMSTYATVVGGMVWVGILGFLIVGGQSYRRAQNLLSQSALASGNCHRCGGTEAFVTDTCQRCGAKRATSATLNPRSVAATGGLGLLALLGKVAMKGAFMVLSFPWLLLVSAVAFVGFMVFGPPSTLGSKVASMLDELVKRDDARLVAMVVEEAKPADWLDAHWLGSAPDAFLAALASGADKWVVSGKVDGLPMMLICFDQRKKPIPRPVELHLFVAHPRADGHPGKTDLLASLTALGCGVQILGLGVYVSHGALEEVSSVDQLRAICLRAAELAQDGNEAAPCS